MFCCSDEEDEAEIENYYRSKYAETQVSERWEVFLFVMFICSRFFLNYTVGIGRRRWRQCLQQDLWCHSIMQLLHSIYSGHWMEHLYNGVLFVTPMFLHVVIFWLFDNWNSRLLWIRTPLASNPFWLQIRAFLLVSSCMEQQDAQLQAVARKPNIQQARLRRFEHDAIHFEIGMLDEA